MIRDILKRANEISDDSEAFNYIQNEMKKIDRGIIDKAVDYLDIFEFDKSLTEDSYFDFGIKLLDKISGIPQKHAIIIIEAIVSHGKTAFMRELLFNLLKLYGNKYKFAFFSYEVKRETIAKQYSLRIYNHVHKTEFSYSSLMKIVNQDKNMKIKLLAAMEVLLKERIFFSGKNYTAKELENAIILTKEKHKELKFVFIDYAQLIRVDDNNGRFDEIQRLMSELLRISKEYEIVIISAAQANRPSKGSNTKQSILSLHNLRESGDIANYADIVIGLWNETVFSGQRGEASGNMSCHEVYLDLLKNRSREGWLKSDIRMDFYPAQFSFREWEETEYRCE